MHDFLLQFSSYTKIFNESMLRRLSRIGRLGIGGEAKAGGVEWRVGGRACSQQQLRKIG